MVTNTADTGAGTLRSMLQTANSNGGTNTIVFQLPGTPPFSLKPASALPALTAPVTIDGTSQPGYAGIPVIELNGSLTSGSTVGLRFSADGCYLRGIAINHFPVQLIELDSNSNRIQGTYIGTDVTGTLARSSGSGSYGILVKKGAGNLIGGNNDTDRNVIAGGNDTGIYLLNTSNNIIQGNYIGVNSAGTASLSNLNSGVVIYGSSSNLIGGILPGAGNVISGNGASGVYLIGAVGAATTGNVITGNYLGLDRAGSNSLANAGGNGVTLVNANSNVISGNIISGNGLAGISISGTPAGGNQVLGNYVGTDASGLTNRPNHLGGVVVNGGGTTVITSNLIAGNLQDGIFLTGGTTNNQVTGNLIGLAANGSNALPNGYNGITISGSSYNHIGGPGPAARNIISGNSYNGVAFLLTSDTGNTVQGNYIGVSPTGMRAFSNLLAGVRIQGCSNIIGGTIAGAGNVISGNGQQGIYLLGTNGNVTGNIIQGNYLGLDATGFGSLGNGDAGIGISGASQNQVGGSVAAARNVIAANLAEGIFIINPGASNNVIQGNYIGTDAAGVAGRGNFFEGITVQSNRNTQIGGVTPGAGNVVSANNNRGIYLSYASGNVLQGNRVGTQADGISPLGNLQHGVDIDVGSSNNVIGGTAAGAGNVFAYAQTYQGSGFCGVRLRDGAVNNLISGNCIFSNNSLGIDLSTYGVTSNYNCESGMAANAANAGQNFPTLATAVSGSLTRITGTMNGKTGRSYLLQFFASPSGDPLGYGEGQVYLGQTNLTLGGSCSTNFTAFVTGPLPSGWVVTATATDTNNNTSEFSAWVAAITMPVVQTTAAGVNHVTFSWTNNGGNFQLVLATNLTAPATWVAVTNLPVLVSNYWWINLLTRNYQISTNYSIFCRLLAL